MDATKTGSFIAQLRKERGLTQKELAQQLLVSDKAISRWEAGHGMPDLDNLEALSRELDVSIAELLRGEPLQEQLPTTEADSLAKDSLSLARELVRRRGVSNIILGILTGIAAVVLATVHLTSPIALPYEEGLVRVEELDSGTLAALSSKDVAGWDVSDAGGEVFVSCHTTRWHQLTGAAGARIAELGASEQISAVLYYPGTPDDVLLYGQIEDAGIMTLPRLVYIMWLMVGIAASAVGLAAWVLLRKRWYASRVMRAALVPVCFTVSLVAVLWGHFDEVYNAAFYLSGICLLAAVLYALALFVLSRRVE